MYKMGYKNIKEEELKNKVAQDYFGLYDCTKIIGNVDFCVAKQYSQNLEELGDAEFLLWAEAKKGNANVYHSFIQLILTIGKVRTFDTYLPPAFLGAFDGEKIAFIPYNDIHNIFYQNDFNWNVTPSNHKTKEFSLIENKVKTSLEANSFLFYFDSDSKELNQFIKDNFIESNQTVSKIKIDKNNFMVIYNKWLQQVKQTIDISWTEAKKKGIIDGDFYLADLLSNENETLKEKLFVLLKKDHYELDRKTDEIGLLFRTTQFTDKQKAHQQFWNKYERPPKKEYWDYISERRDLLVPQDIRERKGSFFTPQIWVEKSQEYLKDVLGDDWQDEYYVWDCAAGTGNLLSGLTNKYQIWASTLDQQDVDVMHQRIETMNKNSASGQGANLLQDHVFRFDFLNDDFSKLPPLLQEIINNEEKRKKLVVYINPPYAEASNKKTLVKGIEGNRAVEQNKTNKKYAQKLGQGNAELFAQLLTRIYFEIPDCKIANFSTLKIISGQHFIDFRKFFKAKLAKAFVCPANTFDNVKGQFPIGFFIWDTSIKKALKKIKTNVFDKAGKKLPTKVYHAYDNSQYINDWVKPFRADAAKNQLIGKFPFKGNDFQNQGMIQIMHHKMDYNVQAGQFLINQKNVIYASVYFAIRHCIDADWLNNNDQFLFPLTKWENDFVFQSNCLAYTLFKNKVQNKFGTNHWIPFTEKEVHAKEKFESNFMTQFIAGKINTEITFDLFSKMDKKSQIPITFSKEATSVFVAGKELWKHYHNQPKVNVNAALYDIREYFQGRNDGGKMNNKSEDEVYMKLINNLRNELKLLAKVIEPKVYEYGFLKD
jgi:hypothetical protein